MYSSVCRIAFTLRHETSDPYEAPTEDIKKALHDRIVDVDESDEWHMAVSFDDTVRDSEGWRLSYNTGGLFDGFWVIERDDDDGRFDDDQEALEYVAKLARQGSVMHKKALATHMTMGDDYPCSGTILPGCPTEQED